MQYRLDESLPFRKVGMVAATLRGVLRRIRMMRIYALNSGKLSAARQVSIGRNASVYVPNRAAIGSEVAIGASFFSQTNFSIGSKCLLSSHVSFIGHDHDLEKAPSVYYSGRLPPSTTILEDNVFIGYGATVLGNVTIGSGAIVGAMSLVVRDVPKNAIVGGVPAKVIRLRQEPASRQ